MSSFGVIWASAFVILNMNGREALLLRPPTEQMHPRSGQHQSGADTAKQSSAPATVARVTVDSHPQQTDPGDAHQKSSSDTTNVLLAVFTGLLVIVGLFQWRALRATVTEAGKAAARQSEDMKGSIAAALVGAEAAKAAARATSASVDKMQEIAERQLRAYVGVDCGGPVTQNASEGYKFEIDPVLTNHGQTPAYDLHQIARLEILPFPIPAEFDFPYGPISDDHSVGVVGAGQKSAMFVVADRMYTQEEIDELGATKRLFVYGVVRYRDVFSRDHVTKFCAYAIAKPERGLWVLANRHNEST